MWDNSVNYEILQLKQDNFRVQDYKWIDIQKFNFSLHSSQKLSVVCEIILKEAISSSLVLH